MELGQEEWISGLCYSCLSTTVVLVLFLVLKGPDTEGRDPGVVFALNNRP